MFVPREHEIYRRITAFIVSLGRFDSQKPRVATRN